MADKKILRHTSGTLAKITRPKLPGVYPRKRLFRQLDNARKRPVVWITRPPGSGKTTLAGSYLDVCKVPTLWYQVDAGDGDVASFFYYMRETAARAKRSKRKPLPLLTPEYLAGLSTFTKNYFRELYHRLKPPFMVVLDNYQEVSSDSLFHQVISDALSEIPEGGSVILVSRSEPPPSLSRLRANRQMSIT